MHTSRTDGIAVNLSLTLCAVESAVRTNLASSSSLLCEGSPRSQSRMAPVDTITVSAPTEKEITASPREYALFRQIDHTHKGVLPLKVQRPHSTA